MKISVYPRILFVALLLAGCSKADVPPPAPVVVPSAAGVYTDLAGAAFAVTDLRATTSTTLAANGSSTQITRVSISGSLADGRAILAGFSVASPAMPFTIGALPMSDPAQEVYYFRVQPPSDTTPSYGVRGQSSGTLMQESTGPGVLSGTYRGPLRPANGGAAPANPPLISFTFAHVAVQP